MQKDFNRILALIDKSEAPDIYIKAAIEIANTFDCNLQIIYCIGANNTEGNKKHKKCRTINGQALLHTYRPILNCRLLLDIHTTQSSVRNAALRLSVKDKYGLIL